MVWLLGQRVQHARQQQGFTRPLAPWKGVGGDASCGKAMA